MRRGLAAIALTLFAVAASAHDLGVVRVTLDAVGEAQYRLHAAIGPSFAAALRPPELPERCAFVGDPGGIRSPQGVGYRFRCDEPLLAGDTISLPWTREGAMLFVRWADGTQATRFFPREGASIVIALSQLAAGSGSVLDSLQRYLLLGIEHMALGIDHLMFVLGLLLVVQSRWMLVKTITAFTLAHSVTLAFATFGILNVPSRPVEAAIALSIVLLAREVLRADSGHPGLTHRAPWVVALGFGLLHGLGFAGALGALGVPPAEIPIALFAFNVGVEIGQLLFVTIVLVAAHAISHLWSPTEFWRRALPAYLMGSLAFYWFTERVLAFA